MKAPQINSLTFATNAVGGFIALALGLPVAAHTAPSGIGSAQDTVNELEDNGFKVVLNKMGAGPLDLCTVDRSVQVKRSPVRFKTAARW